MTAGRPETVADGLPESLGPLLADLIDGLSRIVPDAVGVWVSGSVVLGAFDERSSDIDLIVGADVRYTDEEVDELATLHEDLTRRHTLGSLPARSAEQTSPPTPLRLTCSLTR